jgi:hypothetical protein
MSELSEAVGDAVERAQGGDSGGAHAPTPRDKLNGLVAISVAFAATFTALCNVKDGNIGQAMQQAQANAVDTWATYQAKGTKLNVVESALDALRVQRDVTPGLTAEGRALLDRKIAEYEAKVNGYESDKAELKRTAEGFQKQYEELNVHDDQFDMAEATISISIALLGITALTQKRRLLHVAWAFGAIGFILGVAGFFRLPLHPDFLARLLG